MFRNAFPMPLSCRAREPMEFDIKVTKARRKCLTQEDQISILCGLFMIVLDWCEVWTCGLHSSGFYLLWMSISLIVPDAALLVEESAQLCIAALELPYVDHTLSVTDEMRVISFFTLFHIVSRCFTFFHVAPDIREVKIGHRCRSDWWLRPPYWPGPGLENLALRFHTVQLHFFS